MQGTRNGQGNPGFSTHVMLTRQTLAVVVPWLPYWLTRPRARLQCVSVTAATPQQGFSTF
jgi:hypothetical protein